MVISSDTEHDGRNTVSGQKSLFDGTVVYNPAKGKKFPPEAKITHGFHARNQENRYTRTRFTR